MKNFNLTKFLTTPSKVAHALDWKKHSASLLTLNIYRDNMQMKIANHPACSKESFPLEETIPLRFLWEGNDVRLDRQVTGHLQSLVQSHNVCGIVVSWPLQREGRIGASCGRVLFTLDLLSLDSETSIFSKNRKFCLWCDSKIRVETTDEFGRCTSYVGKPRSDPNFVHAASREQYIQSQIKAANTWDDFLQSHWSVTYKENESCSQNNFDWFTCIDQETSLLQHAAS
jgi:hypothetical protein